MLGFSKRGSSKCLISLTYVTGNHLDQKKPDCDFAYYDIKKHEKKDVIIKELKGIFTEKKKLQNSSNDPEILACQSQIATCLRRIHVKGPNTMKIRKSTIRYVYGDPIVDMLIDSFGYQLEIEEIVGSKDESQVDVSSGSKTDYCCWQLYKKEKPPLRLLA